MDDATIVFLDQSPASLLAAIGHLSAAPAPRLWTRVELVLGAADASS